MEKLLLAAVITLGLSTTSFTNHGEKNADMPVEAIRLAFVDHLNAGFIEQDVFVEKTPGSGKVYRILPEEKEQYLDAEVFAVMEPKAHDPFDVNKSGPFDKGKPLGMNLREWLSAKGHAGYTCEEDNGRFWAVFYNLKPNAIYTIWHFFMPSPPTTPFTGTLDLPLGSRAGDQSIFVADDLGYAQVEIAFDGCLQLSGDQLASGVAIALHSDGKTYGPEPGEFGKTTHVQLFAMLPRADEASAF